jgi:hypothetical protein
MGIINQNNDKSRNALALQLGEEAADYLTSLRSLFNDLADPQLARLVRRMTALN